MFLLFEPYAIPAYIIGKRSATPGPGIAFIPIVGSIIVLFRAARISAWWTFLILVPYVGLLALAIWLAIAVPRQHHRNQWWTLPLLVPGVNIISYFVYAFTLERADASDPSALAPAYAAAPQATSSQE